MYLIFRCGCGRVLYAKEGINTRKCTCGKTLKVKERRIFKKVETQAEAAETAKCKKKYMVELDFKKLVT